MCKEKFKKSENIFYYSSYALTVKQLLVVCYAYFDFWELSIAAYAARRSGILVLCTYHEKV